MSGDSGEAPVYGLIIIPLDDAYLGVDVFEGRGWLIYGFFRYFHDRSIYYVSKCARSFYSRIIKISADKINIKKQLLYC